MVRHKNEPIETREEIINRRAQEIYMAERKAGQGAWVNMPEKQRAEYRARAEAEQTS